jgi:riboflavin synthase
LEPTNVFTGLVTGRGLVKSRLSLGLEVELTVESLFDWEEPLVVGESVSVSGVCLTVTGTSGRRAFKAHVSAESLGLTTLGSQDSVNLERALRLSDRLGGHLVSGHVDALSVLQSRTPAGRSLVCKFSLPKDLAALVVPKGSVALDGVSLTVNEALRDSFTVNIIPQTAKETTLADKSPGRSFNLEVDLIGRHVQRLMEMGWTEKNGRASGDSASSSQDGSQSEGPLTIAGLMSQGF